MLINDWKNWVPLGSMNWDLGMMMLSKFYLYFNYFLPYHILMYSCFLPFIFYFIIILHRHIIYFVKNKIALYINTRLLSLFCRELHYIFYAYSLYLYNCMCTALDIYLLFYY